MEMIDLLNIFENELYMKNHVEVSQVNSVPINIQAKYLKFLLELNDQNSCEKLSENNFEKIYT